MNDTDATLDELRELLAAGQRLAERLREEGRELRTRLAELERNGREPKPEPRLGPEATTPAAGDALESLARRLSDLEAQHFDLLQEHSDLERQNSNYLSLYVASSQIHATLVFDEVLRNIKEILVNLIGADVFAVYVYDESGRNFRRAAWEGNLDPADEVIPFGDNLVSQIVRSAALSLEVEAADLPSGQQPIAILPLTIGPQPIGVVVIFRLLVQKEAFDGFDMELFDLLAAHAATALMSSSKHQRLERKVQTLQGLLDLFKAGGADGGR
jgi:transcriptional regulator with GAF, ATPase, and Fis domain